MVTGRSLMATLTPPPRETFAQVLERLYVSKHTGPVVLHFAHGQPNVIEVPTSSERIVLDKRGEKLKT
jgi:hypothetical protein